MNVGLLSSASALAVVGYTGTVIYHGNLIALLHQLEKDKAFLAWMTAGGIIYFLSKQESIGVPVRMITGVAILAVLLRVFQNGGAGSALSEFRKGNLGLASAADIVATVAGKTLGIYNKPQDNVTPMMKGQTP